MIAGDRAEGRASFESGVHRRTQCQGSPPGRWRGPPLRARAAPGADQPAGGLRAERARLREPGEPMRPRPGGSGESGGEPRARFRGLGRTIPSAVGKTSLRGIRTTGGDRASRQRGVGGNIRGTWFETAGIIRRGPIPTHSGENIVTAWKPSGGINGPSHAQRENNQGANDRLSEQRTSPRTVGEDASWARRSRSRPDRPPRAVGKTGLLDRDPDAFHARVRAVYAAANRAVHDELARSRSGPETGCQADPRRAPAS